MTVDAYSSSSCRATWRVLSFTDMFDLLQFVQENNEAKERARTGRFLKFC